MNRDTVLTHYRRVVLASTIGILFLFLTLPTPTPAEEDPGLTALQQPDFLTSGLYGGGLTFIGTSPYIQLQAQPDIPLGKIRIGLDLVVLYNPYATDTGTQFLAEDGESWDSPSTWLRLIRYVSYAEPYDPFYFRLGELDYLTIGHGSIMSGYSNYDRRGLRVNLRKSNNRYGVETMMNDLGNPMIFGGRLFYRPFLRPKNNNFLTRFELGGTYLTDINPNPQEVAEDPLTALGVDVGFPIIERSTFRFDLYNDFAVLNTLPKEPEDISEEPEEEQLETESTEQEPTRRLESAPIGGEEASATTDFAWGNAVGVGLTFTKAIFKLEYRVLGEGYIPSVFDYTYESAKSLAPEPDMPDFLEFETSQEQIRGFFSQFIWKPGPHFHFFGTFEDYNNSSPKLYIVVSESGLVPRLRVRVLYTKRDIGEGDETNFFADLFDLNEKSAFRLEIGYAIYPPVETIITREYRFRRVETADGISQFEPIHKTSFMVGIRTDF
ncbi:hypothetical protein F4Z99_08115 [Candidatus Poribacteria bacterium]|nr:hypothetical protein [Candidatus Poribacteria bacterium]MYB01376.1 hypothetical protein [Candidatus Poribacteria bacterium]